MAGSNVLRVNALEERTAYRDAVSEIIRRVISERETTLIQIAEAIDVSLGTISNAFNKKADLCPTFLNRLGKAFGPHVLDPYVKLSGGRVIPLEISAERDILPLVARVNLKIVEARDPASPGGVRELPREKANYVPDLRVLRKELDVLICQIEGELAA
jgi:transcriptional regulator with XRE-family HTH domain